MPKLIVVLLILFLVVGLAAIAARNLDLGRIKRAIRMWWWHLRGSRKAPEVAAGDIARIHEDTGKAKAALNARLAQQRSSALISTIPDNPESFAPEDTVELIEPDETPAMPDPRPNDDPWKAEG